MLYTLGTIDISSLTSVVYAFVAFLGSFIILSIIWGGILRVFESLFTKSKLYFLPDVLRSINRSMFLVFVLVGIYMGVIVYNEDLASSAVMKVWGIVFILVVAEIITRVVLGVLDHYYKKSRRSPTFISNALPLIKRITGILIYSITAVLIVSYLSYEVGQIIAAIGILALIFLFILYYNQLKNVMAGIQILGTQIREGDFIEVAGVSGFIEKILEQQVVVRDIDGKTILFPNSFFVDKILKTSYFSEGNMVCFEIGIKGKSIDKVKDKVSSVSGKAALSVDGVIKDYKPKIYASMVKDGNLFFVVKIIVEPNANVRAIVDTFARDFKSTFKDNLIKLSLL